MEQQELSFIDGGNVKWHKTKHTLTIGSSNHSFKGVEIYVYTRTCTRMFIAALFVIAQTWKTPRCPSVGK